MNNTKTVTANIKDKVGVVGTGAVDIAKTVG